MPYSVYIADCVIQLELTLDDIKWAIVGAKKLKIKQEVCLPGRKRETVLNCFHPSL